MLCYAQSHLPRCHTDGFQIHDFLPTIYEGLAFTKDIGDPFAQNHLGSLGPQYLQLVKLVNRAVMPVVTLWPRQRTRKTLASLSLGLRQCA